MEKSGNYKNDESSLGILNMDKVKAFGEISANGSSSRHLSKSLLDERRKALQLLESKPSYSNKENVNVPNIKITNSSTNSREILKSNNTNSSKIRTIEKCNGNDTSSTFNFSELVGDDTMNLDLNSSSQSHVEKAKISFEPTEITARSTLCKSHANKKIMKESSISIKDILNSSHVPKIRNLSETLSTESLSNDWNNLTRTSLPRTADMSKSKATNSEISFSGGNGISFASEQQFNYTGLSKEDFRSYQSIEDKFLVDENSWAQQYAAMPIKAKAKQTSSLSFDTSTNYLSGLDPDFSVGNFFQMRSENIRDMIHAKSPEKNRSPIPLVDEEDLISKSKTAYDYNISLTPQIDNKTYSRVDANLKHKCEDEQHESKDSGNSSDNSYYMSITAIGRALSQMEINTDDSYTAIKNQMLQHKKKKHADVASKIIDEATKKQIESEMVLNMISENKENYDPQVLQDAQFSDTVSFTESLLNSSDLRQQRRSSSSQPRSPLSPLEIKRTSTQDAAHDADVDEWSTTPVKSANRQKRLTKSPSYATPKNQNNINNNNINLKTKISPVEFRKPEEKTVGAHMEPMAGKMETKFVLEKCLNGVNGLEVNCNLSSHLYATTTQTKQTNISSPAKFESPLSSPHSYLSSQTSSPTPSDGYRSPNFNSTTNSERRFLSLGNVRKTASSPVNSESSINKYGVNAYTAVARSCSTNSMRSTASNNGVARSISRASDSSEFSHRDGKVIPLKLTKLELSWGSIKLRKEVRQSTQVKNNSNKRLVVRYEIFGPGYQLVNSHGNILTLQSQECRSIIISFYPTVIGPAIGSLNFYAPHSNSSNSQPLLTVPLYGYGGHSSISIDGMLKGPVGSPFLPLGDIHELKPNRPLERIFKITNKGPLTSFHAVSVNLIGLSRLSVNLEVQPNKLLLPVGQEATIRIIFYPKREEIKKIMTSNTNVYTLADMHIISGDEANRQRIRRLLKRLSKEERNKVNSLVVDKISTLFPDELNMQELDAFTENSEMENIADLLTYLRIDEIALTLNHNNSLDETSDVSSLYFSDADETILFRTICIPSPTSQRTLEPVDELFEKTATVTDVEVPIESTTNEKTWSVTPTSIVYDFDRKKHNEHVSMLIKNFYKTRQYFEVTCNEKNLFTFMPNNGYIESEGGQIEVDIYAIEKPAAEVLKGRVFIMVYLENERITVPVKFKQ